MNNACLELKKRLEDIDEELYLSRDEKLYSLYAGQKKKLTIKTIMGNVEILRRLYVYDNGKETKFVHLLDEYLDLHKMNTKYSNTVIEIITYLHKDEDKSTREIAKFLKDNQVSMSQQTVWDILERNKELLDTKI